VKSKDVTSTTSQQNNIPSWLTDASKSIASGVAGMPSYVPYTGQLSPGMSGNQTMAYNLMPGLLGQGSSIIGSGVNGATTAAGFTAPQISADNVNATTQGLLSPYTQNVVDATNNEIDRSKTLNQQNVDAQFSAAHALMGDRAGVAQAENNRNYDLIKANTDAALYGQGFTQAQNAALGIAGQNQNAALAAPQINVAGANALGNLGNLTQNANISDVSGLLTTGQTLQQTQQNQDTTGYNAYNNNYLLPLQLLQGGAGALGSLPHDTSMTGTSTTPYTSNWGMGLAGLGLGIMGLPMGGGMSLGGSLIGGLMKS
jgi:hypothetical protein